MTTWLEFRARTTVYFSRKLIHFPSPKKETTLFALSLEWGGGTGFPEDGMAMRQSVPKHRPHLHRTRTWNKDG